MDKFKNVRFGGEFVGVRICSRVRTFDKRYTLLFVPMDSFSGSVALDTAASMNKMLRGRVKRGDPSRQVDFSKSKYSVMVMEGKRERRVSLKIFSPSMNIVINGEVT